MNLNHRRRRLVDTLRASIPWPGSWRGAQRSTAEFMLHGCRVDLSGNRIHRAGEWVSLEPKASAVLAVLVENAGEVVRRDTLLDRVWGDVTVSEAVVTVAISALRRALGDSGSSQALIRTIPKSGYRLVAAPTPVRRAHRLGRVGLASAVVLFALALGMWIRLPAVPAPATSVAVLPFRIVGQGDMGEDLARGLTGETIHRLSRQESLRVIAHREIERIASTDTSLRNVGAKCGVDRVVDATMLFGADDEVRLNVSIIDLDLDRHVWSRSFAAPPSRVSELSEDISSEVARVLRGES